MDGERKDVLPLLKTGEDALMAEKSKIKGWRKIAAAAWGAPNDPQIYGDFEFDATRLLEFIDEVREATGTRVTVTTMVGRALAKAFAESPDLNVHMYRGNFIKRDTVDIFIIVSTGGGNELSGVKVARADQKSAIEITDELRARAEKIRSGDDAEFGKTKKMISSTPRRLLKWSIRFSSWLTTDRGVHLPKQGLPKDPFGSAMVTSVGMFGIKHAYAPLAAYYRVPLLVLVGEVSERPWVVDGEVVARPVLNLAATIDHRYIDGYHAARLSRSVSEYMEDPKRFEPPISES